MQAPMWGDTQHLRGHVNADLSSSPPCVKGGSLRSRRGDCFPTSKHYKVIIPQLPVSVYDLPLFFSYLWIFPKNPAAFSMGEFCRDFRLIFLRL